MKLKQLFNDANIPTQKKYFKWYSRLPLIIACLTLLAFCIWGIVDPFVFFDIESVGYYSTKRYYGVMGLSNGFLCWLIWMLIGLAVTPFVYIMSKITLSQKVLSTLYLQALCEQNSTSTDNSQKSEVDVTKELSTLKQLYEAGAITEEEYEIKKKEILGL